MKKVNIWLIVLGLVLLIITSFLSGYAILNHYLDDKEKTKENEFSDVVISDPLVSELYGYVTFEQDSPLYTSYLLKTKDVTISNFSDIEKHFFALQFIKGSDVVVTEEDVNGSPTFTIANNIYQTAMVKFFGPDISAPKNSTYTYIAPFTIENCSWVSFTYDSAAGLYKGVAGGIGGRDMPIKALYNQLVSATKNDDTIIIKAKFIFVATEENQIDIVNTYDYKVYADYARTILLDAKTNMSETDANAFVMTPYLDQANVVTYTFKLGSDNLYHFYSSAVEK